MAEIKQCFQAQLGECRPGLGVQKEDQEKQYILTECQEAHLQRVNS